MKLFFTILLILGVGTVWSQADSVRTTRKMRIEEIANKAPVKMLMPTMIFILPLFIYLFAPIVLQVMSSFQG